MIKFISKYAYEKTTLKSNLIFLGLFLLFVFAVFPFFMINIGHDKKVLDLTFGFCPDLAYLTLQSYGENARLAYTYMLLTADTVFPFVYSIFIINGLSMNLEYLIPLNSKWSRLNLLPLISLFSDLIENTNILIMLYCFPMRNDIAAYFASMFGMLKWSTIVLSVSLIFLSVIMRIIKASKK